MDQIGKLVERVAGVLQALEIEDPTGLSPLQWCKHHDDSLTELPDIKLDGKTHWLAQCNHCKHVIVDLNGK